MKKLFACSDIWTVNKREYIKNFKVNAHTADEFDKKITMQVLYFKMLNTTYRLYIIKTQKCIRRYNDYINDIKELETESTESYAIIQIDILKRQILIHCREWILNFSQLLLEETNELLEGFYKYMEVNSAR